MTGKIIPLVLLVAFAFNGCKSEKKTLAHPQLEEVSWEAEPDGVRLTVLFDQKLELDTLKVYCAMKLNGETGGYRERTVYTHRNRGFELLLEKNYFPGFSPDSLATLDREDLLTEVHLYATPVGKKIVLVQNGNEDRSREHRYFNYILSYDAGNKRIHDNFKELKDLGYVMQVEE